MEPPALPWSTILREQYSEAGLSALFANDPEKASRAKDLWGEYLALLEYDEWVDMMLDDSIKADNSKPPVPNERLAEGSASSHSNPGLIKIRRKPVVGEDPEVELEGFLDPTREQPSERTRFYWDLFSDVFDDRMEVQGE